jgi:hypothetical protein
MFVLQSSTTTAQLRAPFKLASGENRGRTESFFFGAKIAVKKRKIIFKNRPKKKTKNDNKKFDSGMLLNI